MRRRVSTVLTFLIVAVVYLLGGLEPLERGLTSLRFRLVRQPVQSDLVLVTIDAQSLQALDDWPWPRRYHAIVVNALLGSGARRVALDVDFSARTLPEEDAELTRTLRRAGDRVVLPVFRQWEFDVSHGGRLTTVEPLPEFRENTLLGVIDIQPGADGLTRNYRARGSIPGETVPSFATALAGDGPYYAEQFEIDFGLDVDSIPRVSYVDVLTGRFDPAAFLDKAVIVGATAAELGTPISVPRGNALPSCLVQALAYASISGDRALQSTSPVLTLAIGLGIALFIGGRIESASWRRGLAITLLGAAALLALSVIVQSVGPHLLVTSPWVLTIVGIYGLELVRRVDQQSLRLLTQGRRIRTTETMMRHVVENSFDAIVTLEDDGLVVTFNRAAQEMFQYTAPEAEGRNIWEFISVRESDGHEEADVASTLAERLPREALGRRKDDRTFPVELVLTRIETDGRPRQVACMRDITERKAQQRRLEHQATHDPLTDLPNRYLLRRRADLLLTEARQSGSPVAILLLDLDRFKEVNDTLGHHIGDVLLQKLAGRLRRPLGPEDTIARLGGDEFAVLLPGADVVGAQQMAHDLVRVLEEPFAVSGFSLQVEAAIGIAMFPWHGAAAPELLQRADVAMYMAKRKRTRVAVYDTERDSTSIRHLTLSSELRQAIQGQALELHYQPKLDAATGNVCGVEALVRWPHPRLGYIPPDEFIGIAEHSGLIHPLTEWVLETAMANLSEWRRDDLTLGISVNISARNLLDDQVVLIVQRLLASTELPAWLLTLEITESAIMEDPTRALDTITDLCTLGVSISIDDFGTGYSSLGYLRRLPAAELKIDRSFVAQMDRNDEDAMIVRSIVDLAHNLGLRVVAEGVETDAIWESLRELGCDVGQGYLFSRPLPPDRLLDWLRTPQGWRVVEQEPEGSDYEMSHPAVGD